MRTELGIRDQQTEKSNKAINSALRANNINQTVAPRARRKTAPSARSQAVAKLSACHTSSWRTRNRTLTIQHSRLTRAHIPFKVLIKQEISKYE